MRITTIFTVEASADRSWSVIAEQFGDAAEWASSMSSSRLDREEPEVGATRVGQVGKRQVKEKVTRLERDERVFGYELMDPPWILRAATNTWSITDLGSGRSEIESEMHLDLHWLAKPLTPVIRFALNRQLTSAIEEFTVFAETGTPHPRQVD